MPHRASSPHASSPHATDPTLAQAREAFFRASGFPAGGGYEAEQDEAVFGCLRYRVPNTPARAAVLPAHDLHHVLTGYPATWQGEALVSAWELAAGPGRPSYAWVIALWGLFTGLLGLPAQTFRAFLRGRGARSYFAQAPGPLELSRPLLRVRESRGARDERGDSGRPAVALFADGVRFALWSLAAVIFGLVSLPFTAGFVLHAASRPALQRAWHLARTPLCGGCCPLGIARA